MELSDLVNIKFKYNIVKLAKFISIVFIGGKELSL